MLNKFIITSVENIISGFLFLEDKLVRICDVQSDSPVGNIYCGYVKDIVRNINSAFVEFEDKKGFLSLNKIPYKVKCGDKILVQVSGDKIKSKDYKLTWKLNIKGEALILTLGDTSISISKKITDEDKRNQLKEVLLPYKNNEFGFLIRTAALEYPITDIEGQAKELINRYNNCIEKYKHCRVKEAVMVKDNLIEYCDEFVNKYQTEIITDVVEIYDKLHENNIPVCFNDDTKISLVNKYSLTKHLNQALSKTVWLKSGAYLVIEYTEAMTVIDVNTGKADKRACREDTFLKINIEAAKEIIRQLMIRNVSGIIVVDFINMESKTGYKKLIDCLREYSMYDYSVCTVLDVTALGLVEITRKKVEKPLYEIYKI